MRQSWQGQSYYEQYKAYYDNQELSPTDTELWEIIEERHTNTINIMFNRNI
ncbi:MAG: hypothetical protein LBR55_03810 [Bacteroidales bacterium]|jgi:outer membrane cobalamin receptor|nr:hypothetical protein [Bacteroidales bacterium]